MAWFRLDDGFADHPKVLRCSLAAIGLWTKAGAWSAKHLTDGEIPQAAVAALGGSPKLVRELVAAGLWSEHDDGYAFHEWADHQPSRDQVLAKRAATRARVTRCRAPKNAAGNGVTDSVTNDSRNTTPVPSRPDSKQACSPEDVHREWGAALADVAPMAVHSLRSWQADFETVAGACNACDGEPLTACAALCRWFWHAPDGPVQGDRVKPQFAKPSHLAKHVSTDLLAAAAWWATQEAAQ